jgi:hypothetical protein
MAQAGAFAPLITNENERVAPTPGAFETATVNLVSRVGWSEPRVSTNVPVLDSEALHPVGDA